ncbi:hypothetical protein RRG08_032476 [Elysia crispata]|uniref:Uncharacterized protein n=1 Tax=Elysia crispata TaxID=231223 RepID=A0AAE1ECK3_9GAST|nr:hypothetical protein RRG08_032476 [Elysia crispata]
MSHSRRARWDHKQVLRLKWPVGSTVGVSSKPGPRGFPAKELDEKVNVWTRQDRPGPTCGAGSVPSLPALASSRQHVPPPPDPPGFNPLPAQTSDLLVSLS